jgi:ribosomal protein S8
MTRLALERFLNDYPYATVIVKTTKGWFLAKDAVNMLTGGEIMAYIV